MEEPSQELIFKLQMFDQQIKQLQQQLEAVGQGVAEMNNLNSGLDELIGKRGQEVFAPIGRGVFAKAKLESEDLNVDIGGGNFVKKSIPETKKIIEEQVKKLEEIQVELEDNLEKVGEEFNKVILEAQEKEHHHHDHCNCGEEGCKCEKEKKPTKKKIDELV